MGVVGVDGKSYWSLLVGVFADRHRLALQVGAVGWSSSLKLWIGVGQSCGSEVLELLVRVIGWGYWIEFLI